MKFGRLLRDTAGLPNIQTLYSGYKRMKKELKRTADADGSSPDNVELMETSENCFVNSLITVLHEVNHTFVDWEEESIITLHKLEGYMKSCKDVDAQRQLYKEFVDFHGKLLLIMHWSMLAYTTMVKILKKHHKKTGLLVKSPHLANLFSQPFCSTEVLTKLISKTEAYIQDLDPRNRAQLLSAQHHSDPQPIVTSKPQACPLEADPERLHMLADGLPSHTAVYDPSQAAVRSACDSCSLSQSLSDEDMGSDCFEDTECRAPNDEAVEVQSGLRRSGWPCADDSTMTDEANHHGVPPPCWNPVAHQTRIALSTWQQLCQTAVTPSTVLPSQSSR